MRRQMTITVLTWDKNFRSTEVGSFVRSFDNEQPSGNFAVCRVRVGGKRFNRISCERELLVYPTHPATAADGTRFYDACLAQVQKEAARAR